MIRLFLLIAWMCAGCVDFDRLGHLYHPTDLGTDMPRQDLSEPPPDL